MLVKCRYWMLKYVIRRVTAVFQGGTVLWLVRSEVLNLFQKLQRFQRSFILKLQDKSWIPGNEAGEWLYLPLKVLNMATMFWDRSFWVHRYHYCKCFLKLGLFVGGIWLSRSWDSCNGHDTGGGRMRLTLSVAVLTLGERHVTGILLLAKLDSMRVRHVITND